MRSFAISRMLLVALSLLFLSPLGEAVSPGSGTVTVNGQIIDAACAIETGSREQEIDMGVLPLGVIRSQGQGPVKQIEIRLINCRLDKDSDPGQQWQGVKVTFDGHSEGALFQVSGEVQGVGLLLSDSADRQVIPGQSLPRQTIIPSDMRLYYRLRLVSDHTPLHPGHYRTAIRFRMDYE